MLSGLKSKRVILAGDFNSTETLSSFDTGGPLPPSHAKESNAQAIQTLLNEWRFKDLWTREGNDLRETERNSLKHLTYRNNDHTRGHRIDRIYANFAIEVEVTVTTFHHPGSDHRGVLYSWSARAPLREEPGHTTPVLDPDHNICATKRGRLILHA
jgi:endonuclease/exonuclease/phosphatase family metal-dependent hydrolase